MAHILRILILFCLTECVSVALPAKVADLQVEYLTEPLGIDIGQPRFSWQLSAPDHARGQKQTAYRVLVADDASALAKDQADVWDSGEVASEQSVLVPYHGQNLVSGREYFWKVRVWDKDRKPSDWSGVARFSMGLLNPQDWTGSWIAHPSAPAEKHIWYRSNLSLNEPLPSAFAHVASLGYHELYVNGKKVDDRVLAPPLTRLDKRVHYVTYDLSTALKAGKNTLAIWYGPGWSRYDAGPLLTGIFGVPQAIRVQVNGRTASGHAVTLASDTAWRCEVSCSENIGPWRSGGQGDMGGEKIDARRQVPNWNAIDFDDREWPCAKSVAVAAELSAQMIEPTRIIETLPAREVSGNGPYLVDLGRNFTGWIEVKMRGQSPGDAVTVQVANRPGTVQDFGQSNSYVCAGGGPEQFKNRFNYVAGRYIAIAGLKARPGLSDVTGYAVGTDLKRVGHFSSSSALFNSIYETDLWTFRANTIEGFTADCPHRERLGYGEVAFATAWGIGLPNYRAGAFYAKVLRDWSDVQEPSGWVNHTAPQINRHAGGPLWSSAGLNVGWAFYQTYGDQRILEQAYRSNQRWLEFLAAHVSDGLLRPYHEEPGRFLGDWLAPKGRRQLGDSTEALFFNNCVYAMNLKTVSGMAKVLGRSEDVALSGQRLQALKTQINGRFFDSRRNLYLDGRQVSMAFPLLTGIVPEGRRQEVISNFEKEILQTRPYLDAGSSGLPILSKYLIEDAGRGDILFAHLSKTTAPGYGCFLARGETTWPEDWTEDVPSRIHTCYTGIASYFMKSLGGLQPDPAQPGWQEFVIKPVLAGDLKFVEASTESMYGPIVCRWERVGGLIRMGVTVPVNSRATVYLPAGDMKQLLESGNNLESVKGVKLLKIEGGYAVLRVESGRYEFSSSLPTIEGSRAKSKPLLGLFQPAKSER